MFNNIGGKIKAVAKIECWAGIISSVITGIDLISSEEEFLVFLGIIIMISGSIAAWLGSFLIYGFGQLVENSDIIAGRKKIKDVKKEEKIETIEEEFMLELDGKSDEAKLQELNKALSEERISYLEYLDLVKDINCENQEIE